LLFFLSGPSWSLRVVSLLPSNTEIVDALGAGDQLVGVTKFDTLSSSFSRVNVGDFLNPQWEVLLALKPDLVLAGYWPSSPTAQRLRSLGIRVVEIRHPATLAELDASIRQIARDIQLSPARADALIRSMHVRLDALRRHHAARPLRRLYLEIDPPSWTIGQQDCLNEGFDILRLRNVFEDIPRKAAQVSSEAIVEKDPQVILTFHAKAEDIARRPGWSAVSAVRTRHIITDFPADDLVRPSPRLVDGLEKLSRRLDALEPI